jgi:hypothetical protein
MTKRLAFADRTRSRNDLNDVWRLADPPGRMNAEAIRTGQSLGLEERPRIKNDPPFFVLVKSRAREPQKELTNEQQQRAKAQNIYGCVSAA